MNTNVLSIAMEESPPWGGYDFEKPSLAVVTTNDRDEGILLWYVGGHIAMEVKEAGLSHLDDLGLHPPEAGVWIWEGRYIWSSGSYEYPMDGSSDPVGNWRKPTEEEWQTIKDGDCPWDDEEWKLEKYRSNAFEGPQEVGEF